MGYKRRGYYTPEFKGEAVRRAGEGQETLTELAEQLGISRPLLASWCKKAGVRAEVPAEDGEAMEQEAEIRRLRRQVEQLREEREILKKAAAFFAKESR
jgi:transposase